MDGTYLYGPAWKATVDKASPEWMAYCEARTLVKRYIVTRRAEGKEAAINEFERTCCTYQSVGRNGPARVQRLRDIFRVIWKHERTTLEVT